MSVMVVSQSRCQVLSEYLVLRKEVSSRFLKIGGGVGEWGGGGQC